MNRCWILAVISLMSFTLSAYAQEETATIYGTVKAYYDESAKRSYPTPGALVQVFFKNGEKKDSLYTTTDYSGLFVFKKLKPQDVVVRVRHMGFAAHEEKYAIEAGGNAIFITLKTETMLLKEAAVTAEMQLLKQVKDTTIFNAAAVNTQNDESVAAILQQLPGFEVSSSSISVDGQTIKKTYVNGKLIFGDSPMTAVGAVKAKEVKEIKVYEEISAVDKHRGLKNAQKDKVLDIVTKEQMISLTELTSSAFGGVDEAGTARLHGGFGASFNSEMTNGTVVFTAGNLNGSDNFFPGGAIIFLRNGINTEPTSLGDPISNDDLAHNLTLNGRKHWKDRQFGNSLSVDYTFMHKRHKSAQSAIKDYFETENSPELTYCDTNSNESVSRAHKLRLTADLKDTPLKSITISAEAAIDESSSSATAAERIITAGNPVDIYSRTETGSRNHNTDYKFSLNWLNNDGHTKLQPGVSLALYVGNGNGDGWTLDTLESSVTRRQLHSDNVGKYLDSSAKVFLNGLLVNSENRTIDLIADFQSSFSNKTNRQIAKDYLSSEDGIIDPASSFDYTWKTLNNAVTLSSSYTTKTLRASGALNAAFITCLDDESYPASEKYTRSYFQAIPQFSFFYNAHPYSVSLNINGYSNLPSMEQTRDRISDANPLALTGGNKDLRPGFTLSNRFGITRTGIGDRKTTKIGLSLDALINFNSIVSKSTYFYSDTVLPEWDGYIAKAGAMLHTFENAGRPTYNIKIAPSFYDVYFSRKLIFSIHPSYTFSTDNQYIGGKLIGIANNRALLSINASWREKTYSIMAFPTVSWLNSTNDHGSLLTESLNYSARLIASKSFFNNRLSIGGRYNFSAYKYFSAVGRDDFRQNLCFYIRAKFFKNALEVSLTGGDMLSSGSNYSASQNAISYTQSWNKNYGRYVIVGANYRFRHKK